MPAINSDNVEAWKQLAKDLSKDRPDVGKTVLVQSGKHKDKIGVVKRHMVDRYTQAYRYASEAQAHYRDMAGRYGWVVLIDTGTEKPFWVKADKVEVKHEKA
jgi:hypothetical protein